MVDAAYYREDIQETYFFGGTRYARIEFTPATNKERITVGPRKTVPHWPALAKAGFGTVDAILPHPTSKDEAYFFFGGRYIRMNVPNDTIAYGIDKITDNWKSLAQAGFDTVDAAFLVPGVYAQAYVFRGVNYVRINMFEDKTVFGPKNITELWPGLAKAGFDSVDAALAVPGTNDGQTYFFKGDRYVKTRVVAGEPDEIIWGPKDIEECWKTLNWI